MLGAVIPRRRSYTDISDVQRQAWQNKLAKDFNTTDVALEFGLLAAEVGEAFTAWRRSESGFGGVLRRNACASFSRFGMPKRGGASRP